MKLVSFDSNNINDTTNYTSFISAAGQTPAEVEGQYVQRDGLYGLVGGITFPARYVVLTITIKDSSNKRTLQQQLYQWFDPADGTAKQLVWEDDDGTDDRYVEAVPLALPHIADGDGWVFEVLLMVHDDTYPRSTSASSDTFNITATGQTKAVTNGSSPENTDAFPVYTFKPTATKSAGGGSDTSSFFAVQWNSSSSATQYPTDIANAAWDTAAIVTATNMQADGDDIRVFVNSVDTDYWLDDINTTTTKVWVNLDFSANISMTLNGAMGTGSITTLQVNESISSMPTSGILEIDSEIFTYTGKNTSTKTFTGVTRAAKNTTAASHSDNAAVGWIQHDITVTYGDATLTAKSTDDTYKPIFDLTTSTNTSWDYNEFYESTASRSGAWSFSNIEKSASYGGNQDTTADPFEELGIKDNVGGSTNKVVKGRWALFNPCGITAGNFQNGHKRRGSTSTANWNAYVKSSINGSSLTTEYTIPDTAAVDTWETWSQNVTGITTGSKYLYLDFDGTGSSTKRQYVEVSDVTVTINSSNTPTSSVYAGTAGDNYLLDCTFTNNTTSESISLNYALDLDESLEVDTANQTVKYLKDNSNAISALTVDGGPRLQWLKMQPGSNTFQYDETGVAGLTVTFSWRKRYRV